MDIISNYQSLLESIGFEVATNGTVSTKTIEGSLPTTINGLRLILPIPELLRDPDWTTTIAFHPLSEQINAGESLVQRTLCLWITARLTTTLRVLAEEIALLAADTDRHRTLTIRQSKILKEIPTLNEKTIKKLLKIFDRATLDGEYRLINLYQARGKDLNGTLFPRVTFIEFPILARLKAVANAETDELDVFGVSGLTKNDITSLIGLFNIVIGNDTSYSFGSNHSNAPFFHSLLGAYKNLASQFNGLLALLGDIIEDGNELKIGGEWAIELIDNLSAYIGKIPPLEHNRGDRKAPPASQRHSLMSQVAQTNVRTNALPIQPQEPTRTTPKTRTQIVEIVDDAEDVDASNIPAVKTSNWGNTLKKLRVPVTAITSPEEQHGQPRGANINGQGRLMGYDANGYPIYEQPIVEQPRIVGRMSNGEPIYDRPPSGLPVMDNRGYQQPRGQSYPTQGQYHDPRQQSYYASNSPQPVRMSNRQLANGRPR